MSLQQDRLHGGPDAQGVPRWDFSTNANACGPCPTALAALYQADAQHYPDPAYTALRAALAGFHGVAIERVVVAARVAKGGDATARAGDLEGMSEPIAVNATGVRLLIDRVRN